MWRGREQLLGALPEVPYLGSQGFQLQRVRQLSKVYVFLQGLRLEKVVLKLCAFSSLLVPEHKVDPLMQIGACMIGLECKPILHDEVLMAGGPGGQANISNPIAEVVGAQIQVMPVFHEGPIPEVELRC